MTESQAVELTNSLPLLVGFSSCLSHSELPHVKLLIRWTTQQSLTTHNTDFSHSRRLRELSFPLPRALHWNQVCGSEWRQNWKRRQQSLWQTGFSPQTRLWSGKREESELLFPHFNPLPPKPLPLNVSATTPPQIWVEIHKKDRYYSIYTV